QCRRAAEIHRRPPDGRDRRPRSPPLPRVRRRVGTARPARSAGLAHHRARGRQRATGLAAARARGTAGPSRRRAPRPACRFPHRSRRPRGGEQTRPACRRSVVGRRTAGACGFTPAVPEGDSLMMTIDLYVSDPTLTGERGQALAAHVLHTITAADAAPDAVMARAREFTHVLVHHPAAWATGGPSLSGAPRYLARVTVPGSWAGPGFGDGIIPL